MSLWSVGVDNDIIIIIIIIIIIPHVDANMEEGKEKEKRQ